MSVAYPEIQGVLSDRSVGVRTVLDLELRSGRLCRLNAVDAGAFVSFQLPSKKTARRPQIRRACAPLQGTAARITAASGWVERRC